MHRAKNGSVIGLVLIIAATTGLVIGSLVKVSMVEKEFNDDSRLILEAKEGAEAAVECGFAQLVRRFETRTSFPINALSPSNGNPLVLTDDFYTLFGGGSGRSETSILLPAAPYNAQAQWGSQDTELIGGLILPGEWKFIDGRVPGNEFDPLRDKLVFIREVEVYGKATVENAATGYSYTAHVTQTLQVRDAPLFAHAVFYNMDLEIAPGPDMDIMGAVHANGKMFIQANNSLDFLKNVSATGKIYHGPNPIISKGIAYGDVTFPNGASQQVSMLNYGGWLDSNNDDFRSLASNLWDGNVQGAEHGVPVHKAVAIEEYVRDNPDTATVDDQINPAYQLLQPTLNTGDAAFNPEVENQKFSTKAGLVIEVEVDANSPTGFDVQGYAHVTDASGNLVYDGSGNPERVSLDVSAFVTVEPYDASGDTVTGGLYDKRQGQGMNLVTIDVGQLSTLVEGNDGGNWGGSASSPQTPENWWNGVVYVDVPQQSDPARPDHVVPARQSYDEITQTTTTTYIDKKGKTRTTTTTETVVQDGTGLGLKLENGENIPNPAFGWLKDLYGTSFATNAPLYLEGNFNADGDPSTGSASQPDSADVRFEPPAALMADAITVLSNSWDDANSLKSVGSRVTNAYTEVAAAFLTGLVPSNKNGANNYSGGVENFPRFLEDWNTTFRYRGSMVSLFESEVNTEPWGKSDVYDPPTRDWGFNSLYAQGYYPPGTPNSRTFRRVNYRNLSESEYTTSLTDLASQL